MNENKSFVEPIYFIFTHNHGNTTTKCNISNNMHKQTHNNIIECKCIGNKIK